MDNTEAAAIINKVAQDVFGVPCHFSFEEFMQKFAQDIPLPIEAIDSNTGKTTWATSLAPKKYMSYETIVKHGIEQNDWMFPKQSITSMDQLLDAWNKVNYWATDHIKESEEVAESDSVYQSQRVFRSVDVQESNNIVLSSVVRESEYVVASRNTTMSQYCIRLNLGKKCASSFEVSLSGKIVKSLFIHDCYDLFECLFCSHLTGKQYCIANMQFEKEEYFAIKKMVISWLLSK